MRASLLQRLLVIVVFPFLTAHGQVTVETLTAPFNASGGVAIDDSGIVYVADFGQSLGFANGTSVYKVLGDGTVSLFSSGFQGASGNDFDSQGNLFQSNIAGNFVSRITPDGSNFPWASIGITGPVGCAVGPGDTIWVANCGGNSIARVNPDQTSSVWASSPLLACPNGLTMDDDGNLYTCNFANGNIIKITPSKVFSVLATLPGGRCGHLTYFEGNLYAVARCAQKIYKITLAGDTSLVAGSGGRGNDDGIGVLATFNHANGIRGRRVGDNIELYINDAVSTSGNCTSVPLNPVVLRKITIGPVDVSTLADPDSSIVSISDTLLQANGSDSTELVVTPLNYVGQAPSSGVDSVTISVSGAGTVASPAIDNLDGTFSSYLTSASTVGDDTISTSVHIGDSTFQLTTQPTIHYWQCGDINGEGDGINIADLTYLVAYSFRSGPEPPIVAAADVDGISGVNIADVTYLVTYFFRQGSDLICM
jgi:hypothetical protein